MTKQVRTVLGLKNPDRLGITDAHNHIWISRQKGIFEEAPVLDQEDQITAELISFQTAGGGSQVDCQPGEAGRDGRKLVQLSAASGVPIIACTGFHLMDYYPEGSKIREMDAARMVDYLLSEIYQGLEETRSTRQEVYPGLIKIAVRETLQKTPLHLLDAAVEASKQSGLMIAMHTEKGANAAEFVNYISQQGVSLERLTVCHIDKLPDLGLHQELAQAGCLLEYDTFFRPKYGPEKNLWPLLRKMVADDYSHAIACATDLADSRLWKSMGTGPGLVGLITIRKRLEEELQNLEVVKQLVGRNIAERMAVFDKEKPQ